MKANTAPADVNIAPLGMGVFAQNPVLWYHLAVELRVREAASIPPTQLWECSLFTLAYSRVQIP